MAFVTKNIDGTTPWDIAKNPNSCMLEYAGGESVANMLDAIGAFITAHGWVLHDAAAGTNARAYKSLCADGLGYKYIVIDANTANMLLQKNYESWNATTHAGTNLAYFSDSISYGQRYDLTAPGKVYLFSHSRWLALFTMCSLGNGASIGTSFTGVFETEQAELSVHPYCLWVSGTRLYSNGSSGSGPVSPYRISCTGATGSTASTTSAVALSFSYGGQLANNTFTTLAAMAASGVEFQSGKRPISNLNWLGDPRANPYNLSRVLGLKVTGKNAGSFLDTLTLQCDADYFLSPAGSNTPHVFFFETQFSGGLAIPI